MGQIIISRKANLYLDGLVDILYNKSYFGYRNSAEVYVERLRNFIEKIPEQPLKPCKNPKYGKYYARYDNPKSKMSYYITFDTLDDICYIEDIITPQTREYRAIRGY